MPDAGRAWRTGDDPRRLARRLHVAHDKFVSTGVPGADVRPMIAASWRRAVAGGIDPEHSLAPVELCDDELVEYREHHPLAATMPVVRRLLGDHATEAGLLVAVSDAAGRLLWVEGLAVMRARAESMNFVAGARWAEHTAGTNAPGTALALGRPVQIFAAEHLMRSATAWSCTAAPIHDPHTGSVLGALDVTGGDEVAAPHNLALVRAVVAAVEAELRAVRPVHVGPLELPGATAADVRLEALGSAGAVVHLRGTTVQLSLRHAELLIVLAAHPDGLDGPALSVALHECDPPSVTLRAEISRLRALLGPDVIRSRPYRLGEQLRTDADHVRDLLARGALAAAVAHYRGPLLPRSAAPAVVRARENLHQQLRAAALGSGDADVVLALAQQTAGRLDGELWHTAARALSPADPRQALVAGHLVWMERELTGGGT